MSVRRKGSSAASPRENVWPPYPPPDESDLDKTLRAEEEREAKHVSDAIDRALEAERLALKKKKGGEIKLLLLGQSESGKSTMLKNFQHKYTPAALRAEAGAWRAVVHLNLVRSVNFVLDVLSSQSAPTAAAQPATYNPATGAAAGVGVDLGAVAGSGVPSAPAGDAAPSPFRMSAPPPPTGSSASSFSPPPTAGGMSAAAGEVRRYKLALSPLRHVEAVLARTLSAEDARDGAGAGVRAPEVAVRGGRGWKALIAKNLAGGARRGAGQGGASLEEQELADARRILDACKADVVGLWGSKSVRTALWDAGVELQEQSGFFLNQAARIADANYEPTLDDILRARLQTVGVEEHRLAMETAAEYGQQWIFYDVGGARGQRASWVPFFQDVNAIIFLASTSGFNEVLLEDRTVNRLLDSFTLWKTVCSSRLLGHVQFILLLNKTDLLAARLKAGVQFSSYVKSYKDENDPTRVVEYLKKKFTAMHHHHSPTERKLHVHSTCAINIDTTSAVLSRIRDTILVKSLEATHII